MCNTWSQEGASGKYYWEDEVGAKGASMLPVVSIKTTNLRKTSDGNYEVK